MIPHHNQTIKERKSERTTSETGLNSFKQTFTLILGEQKGKQKHGQLGRRIDGWTGVEKEVAKNFILHTKGFHIKRNWHNQACMQRTDCTKANKHTFHAPELFPFATKEKCGGTGENNN
jgi:hypothetical protein